MARGSGGAVIGDLLLAGLIVGGVYYLVTHLKKSAAGAVVVPSMQQYEAPNSGTSAAGFQTVWNATPPFVNPDEGAI